jgi:hypothetical protein
MPTVLSLAVGTCMRQPKSDRALGSWRPSASTAAPLLVRALAKAPPYSPRSDAAGAWRCIAVARGSAPSGPLPGRARGLRGTHSPEAIMTDRTAFRGLAHDHVQPDAKAKGAAMLGRGRACFGDLLGYRARGFAPGQVHVDLLASKFDGRVGRAAEPQRRIRFLNWRVQRLRALHAQVLAGEARWRQPSATRTPTQDLESGPQS